MAEDVKDGVDERMEREDGIGNDDEDELHVSGCPHKQKSVYIFRAFRCIAADG